MDNINDIKVGDRVSFSIIHNFDNNTYVGTVTSLCSYVIAKQFQDLIPVYEAIKKVDPTMASIELLNYIILEQNQNGISSTAIIAQEWIEPSSFSYLDYLEYFDVRVFNRFTDTDKRNVLDLLAANGYTCKII